MCIRDSVCNMNDASAKRSTWIVRIDHSRIVEYSFISRGETVLAQKMICTLIGKDGTDYGPGIIPYCFKNKKRALQGMTNPKFLEGQVLRIRKLVFDKRTTSVWISSPAKVLVVLDAPGSSVETASHELQDVPAKHAEPRLRLKEILELDQTRNVDFAFIVESVSPVRCSKKEGDATVTVDDVVRDVVIMDDSDYGASDAAQTFKASFACWGKKLCDEFEGKEGMAGRVFYGRAKKNLSLIHI